MDPHNYKKSKSIDEKTRTSKDQSKRKTVRFPATYASGRLSDTTGHKQLTQKATSTIQGGSDMEFEDKFHVDRSINVKQTNDSKDCLIVSMTSISNNELCIVDSNNKSVKKINVDTDAIGSITFDYEPTYVTRLPENKVAVTFPEEHSMKILSTKSNLTTKETIKLSGKCLAVECYNDSMYASYTDPVQFQKLGMSGGVIKTIKPDSECLKYIRKPRFIAVNITGTKGVLYISDYESGAIVSIDLNGSVLGVYEDDGLVEPYDIIFTPFDSIYVCNSVKDIIYKMSKDLKEGLVVLGSKDELESPCSMCFCQGKKSLYVSSRTEVPKCQNFIKKFKYD